MKLSGIKIQKEGFLQGDSVVWMILLALCMISIVEVYSASSRMTYSSGHYWGPVVEHTSYVAIGLFITWLIHKMPCKSFKFLSVLGLFVSFILLIVVLFMGSINDAARWIRIFGITIQPSEFAKISLVGTVAMLLATFRDKTTGGASQLAFNCVALLTGVICLLIVGENFSTASIIFIVMFLMTWYAQAPKKWMWIVIISIVAVGGLGYSILKFTPDRTAHKVSELPMLHRFETWSNRIKSGSDLPNDPAEYNIHDNVQVTHARIAVATCNVVGKGPGQSVERDFLPHAVSDFIYAIIIEEAGIEGGILVMFLYLLLLYRAMRIAERCRNRFPAYLAMGLSLMLVVQAMVNMAVSVGAMPVTGQPLPLVSKGGTSTFITCAYIGMILSVSYTAKKIEEKPEQTEI
ncbi:MAG: FtsW/RodA/SpoVE family cell cycle protein [Bacteroidaceae bacterium]|nr:FtsW/RodA/SpoVE family cell cycle protein [Bacteroidaceae bacterium]